MDAKQIEQRSSISRRGRMLMVVPSNLESHDGEHILDGDFADYVRRYLDAFEQVVVACPLAPAGTFPTLEPLAAVRHDGRLKIIVLPEPYREDRYFRKKRQVAAILREEIGLADVIVIAPHAPFDWSTLAAKLCIEAGKPYNMEGDWNLQQVSWSSWDKLPFGIQKIRRYFWMKHHDPIYFSAMRHSTVALLHGYDVFEAYRDIAPNPHMVDNYCVTPEDRITDDELNDKLARATYGAELNIVYAGRAIGMKGPMEWLESLLLLREAGVRFRATWFGDGDQLERMREFAASRAFGEQVCIAGRVGRDEVFTALKTADLFLFCHLTRESPRNLVESLAAGAPIVGFGSPYSDHLVARHGGGQFVATGDVAALANAVIELDRDRKRLSGLIAAAARTGSHFDRDESVAHRIELMKRYLIPAKDRQET